MSRYLVDLGASLPITFAPAAPAMPPRLNRFKGIDHRAPKSSAEQRYLVLTLVLSSPLHQPTMPPPPGKGEEFSARKQNCSPDYLREHARSTNVRTTWDHQVCQRLDPMVWTDRIPEPDGSGSRMDPGRGSGSDWAAAASGSSWRAV